MFSIYTTPMVILVQEKAREPLKPRMESAYQ